MEMDGEVKAEQRRGELEENTYIYIHCTTIVSLSRCTFYLYFLAEK